MKRDFDNLVAIESTDAVVVTTPAGMVVYWNRGAEALFGYMSAEAIGRWINEIIVPPDRIEIECKILRQTLENGSATYHIGNHFSCFYPPEAIAEGKPEQELRTAMEQGHTEDEGWRVRKDGQLFWANVGITALRDKDGRLQGFAEVTRDMTERERSLWSIYDKNIELAQARSDLAVMQSEQAIRISELSYRRLFETAQDGILILDFDTGRISDVNPFLVELLGFSYDEMVDKTIGELSLFKDIDSNKSILDRLQKYRRVRFDDLPLVTKDNRRIAVEFVSDMYHVGDRNVINATSATSQRAKTRKIKYAV